MANVLRVKRIDEISLVDKGASGNALTKPAIVIAKRRSGEMPEKNNGNGEATAALKALVKLLSKGGEGGPTLDEVLGKLGEAEKAVILNALEAAAKPPPAAPPADDEEEKRKAALAKQLAALPEDIRKSLVEGDLARREAALAKRESDELRKRLDAIEEEREMERFIAKAKAMPFLAGASIDEVAKALRAVKKGAPTEYDKIVKVLESAEAAVKTSKLWQAPGVRSVPSDDEPVGKLHSIAKKLVADGLAKSESEAMAKAAQQNPDLYAEYKADLLARARGVQ